MKKLLKRRVKKLKYYDGALNAREALIGAIDQYDFRECRRFIKETQLVTELFICHIYNSLPESYDKDENPTGKITKKEAYETIIYPREGTVIKSGFNFIYIPEDKFIILLELYKELNER